MSTVLCPLTLRSLPCPFPRHPFLLYLSASSVFISSFWFWTSLMSSVLHYPFFHFHCCHQVSACCFWIFCNLWGGWRKEKDKSPPVVGVKKKKQLFMTRGEDRLTSGCWRGWVLGTGRNFSLCPQMEEGSRHFVLPLFSRAVMSDSLRPHGL